MDIEILKAITNNSLAYELSLHEDDKFLVVSRKDNHFNTEDIDYWEDCRNKLLLNNEFLSLNIFNPENISYVHPNFISGHVREFRSKDTVLNLVILTSIEINQIEKFTEQITNFDFEIEHPSNEDLKMAKEFLKKTNREPIYIVVPVIRIHSFCIQQ